MDTDKNNKNYKYINTKLYFSLRFKVKILNINIFMHNLKFH